MVKYKLISEIDVEASADFLWPVLSSKEIPKLVKQKNIPSSYEKVEVLEGDGGLGTIVHIVHPPGSVPVSYTQKIVTVDNHKRFQEIKQIEGGYLDMGVTLYIESFQVIEKDGDSSVVKSMVRYEVPDDLAPKVSHLITPEDQLTRIKAGVKYALKHKK